MKDAFGVEVSKAMFPGAAARVIPKTLKSLKPSPLVASKVRPPTTGIKPMTPTGPKSIKRSPYSSPTTGIKPMTPTGPRTPSGTPMTNNARFASRINPR